MIINKKTKIIATIGPSSDKELILEKMAANLRAERARKKYSQDKVAKMAEITEKYYNMIENAKSNPSIIIIFKICQALEIDLNTLFL